MLQWTSECVQPQSSEGDSEDARNWAKGEDSEGGALNLDR